MTWYISVVRNSLKRLFVIRATKWLPFFKKLICSVLCIRCAKHQDAIKWVILCKNIISTHAPFSTVTMLQTIWCAYMAVTKNSTVQAFFPTRTLDPWVWDRYVVPERCIILPFYYIFTVLYFSYWNKLIIIRHVSRVLCFQTLLLNSHNMRRSCLKPLTTTIHLNCL